MTPGVEDHDVVNDRAFAAAWTAFAEQDARATAPPALEARVRAAADAEYRRRRATLRPVRHTRLIIGLGMAALVFIVAAAGFMSRRGVADLPAGAGHVASGIDVEPLRRPQFSVTREATADPPQTIAANTDGLAVPNVPDPLVTLAVDPIQETEQLALVHIRVPQDALRAIGISTNEPVTSGLVDVEVLVGGDGLPRDIRTIRTVVSDQRELTN